MRTIPRSAVVATGIAAAGIFAAYVATRYAVRERKPAMLHRFLLPALHDPTDSRRHLMRCIVRDQSRSVVQSAVLGDQLSVPCCEQTPSF